MSASNVPSNHATIEALTAELGEAKDQLRRAQASLGCSARDAVEQAARAKRVEQSRLAQMLHDGLQQLLVAARMRLERTLRLLPNGGAKHAVLEAKGLLVEAIEATRTLTTDLGPTHSVGRDLGSALICMRDGFATQHGLKVRVEVAANAELESESLRELVVQCVRELLFNIVKHAGSGDARVHVAKTGTDVQIVVEDFGIGFDPTVVEGKMNGFGLLSVKQRMEMLGGSMEVDSAPGAGTCVKLNAPAVQCGVVH